MVAMMCCIQCNIPCPDVKSDRREAGMPTHRMSYLLLLYGAGLQICPYVHIVYIRLSWHGHCYRMHADGYHLEWASSQVSCPSLAMFWHCFWPLFQRGCLCICCLSQVLSYRLLPLIGATGSWWTIPVGRLITCRYGRFKVDYGLQPSICCEYRVVR